MAYVYGTCLQCVMAGSEQARPTYGFQSMHKVDQVASDLSGFCVHVQPYMGENGLYPRRHICHELGFGSCSRLCAFWHD